MKIVSEPESFRAWLGQFGAFDELVFILIRAAQTVVKFIPAEPLEIASGYAWGTVSGMLYCVIGNMIGTLVIFALTRRYGKKILKLPGSPKDGFTYFVGLLPVKLIPFMVITFIARMPSVLSSTLCGSSIAEQRYWIAVLIFVAPVILAILGGIAYNAFVKWKEQKKNKGVDLSVQYK